MARRVSKVNGIFEYVPAKQIRLTSTKAIVEYLEAKYCRLSNIAIMVEYCNSSEQVSTRISLLGVGR